MATNGKVIAGRKKRASTLALEDEVKDVSLFLRHLFISSGLSSALVGLDRMVRSCGPRTFFVDQRNHGTLWSGNETRRDSGTWMIASPHKGESAAHDHLFELPVVLPLHSTLCGLVTS